MKNLLEKLLKNNDFRNKAKVVSGGLILLVALVFFFFRNDSSQDITIFGEMGNKVTSYDSLESPKTEDQQDLPQEEAPPLTIFLDVAGAVLKPGIVTLPEGSRVFEAIECAGGILPQGDLTYINLAEKVQDGDKIYIPTVEETAKNETLMPVSTPNKGSFISSNSSGIQRQGSESSKLININTASSEELQSLTGVGPSTAEKIIQYRQTSGPFEKIQDIKNVSGIGEKTFQKFMDKICTN